MTMQVVLGITFLLLCLALGKIQDYPTSYDYVVVGAGAVGAGAAGATVASRLSEKNFASVLLIEAGPGPPKLTDIPLFAFLYESGTAINWNYTIEPNGKSCLGAKNKINVVADLPVGQNLQDHVSSPLAFNVSHSNQSTLMDNMELLNKTKSPSFKYPNILTGVLSSPFEVEVSGYLRSEFEKIKDYNDVQFFLLTGVGSQRFYNDKLQMLFGKYLAKPGFIVGPAVLHMKSRGNITLRSTDPFSPPLIYMNYFSDPEDIKVLVFGLKKARELAATEALKGFKAVEIGPIPGCKKLKMESDEYLECVARTLTVSLYHGSSTCKMGRLNDSSTVVDSKLRVKGVKNLRVVDASIMPRVVSGNTNAATIMIGEKAADMIRKRLK